MTKRESALDVTDHEAVIAFCRVKGIGLVVIGPEAPLVDGLADSLRAFGILVFGPSASAARLEGSKGFTKDLCAEHDIPTARFRRFASAADAHHYVAVHPLPVVVSDRPDAMQIRQKQQEQAQAVPMPEAPRMPRQTDATFVDGRQQAQPSMRPGESVGSVSFSSGPRTGDASGGVEQWGG